MCFTPKMPDVKQPTAPPTERDGALEGVKQRQAAVASSEKGGLLATNPTGAAGVTTAAPVYKSTLG